MEKPDVQRIMAANPQIDQASFEEGEAYLQELRAMGFAPKRYSMEQTFIRPVREAEAEGGNAFTGE